MQSAIRPQQESSSTHASTAPIAPQATHPSPTEAIMSLMQQLALVDTQIDLTSRYTPNVTSYYEDKKRELLRELASLQNA